MRPAVLVACALLASLAVVPASSAELDPDCDPTTIVLDIRNPSVCGVSPACPPLEISQETGMGRDTLTVNADCTIDVVLNEGIICVGPWIVRSEYEIGPLHIVSYSCGPPGGGPIDPGELISIEMQGVCKEGGLDSGLVGALTHEDCTVEIVILSGLNCLWGTEKKTTQIGPVLITQYRCRNPDV